MTTGDSTPAHAAPFDPIVLDLTAQDDYSVLTEALDGYAAQMEHEADADDESERHAGKETPSPLATHFRDSAARAWKMVEAVHRQLDDNAAMRRGR